jgi:hypothetical protein
VPELFGTQQNMKFILDSVNSQGLPSYEDVTGMGGEDEGKRASTGSNTSKFQLFSLFHLKYKTMEFLAYQKLMAMNR